MIDVDVEEPLSLPDAAKSLPGRPSLCTLHRWARRGIGNQRLETVLVGGRRFTSREALQRFIEQRTAAAEGQPIRTRTTRQREAAIRRAERELADNGI